MQFDEEERTAADGTGQIQTEARRAADRSVERIERRIGAVESRVSAVEARLLVQEALRSDQATRALAGPTKSELFAAIRTLPAATSSEKRSEAIEALKTVGPWVMALLGVLAALVQALKP